MRHSKCVKPRPTAPGLRLSPSHVTPSLTTPGTDVVMELFYTIPLLSNSPGDLG